MNEENKNATFDDPKIHETPEFNTTEPKTQVQGDRNFSSEQPEQNIKTDKFIKSFELSHEDIRCALYSLLNPREDEDDDCFYIDEVYDEYFDYLSYKEHKTYRQGYSKDGENISFTDEPFEIFVVKVTADEKAALEQMKNGYLDMEKEVNELKEYKANVEKVTLDAKKTAILDKWSEILKDNESFSQLKTNIDGYSVDEIETKCKCIFADTKATFSLKSTKEQSMVKIPISTHSTNTNSRYGDLFDRFASKE